MKVGDKSIPYSPADNGYVIGDISGDTNVTVVTRVSTDKDHAQNPYTAVFQPSITYQSDKNAAGTASASAGQLQQTIIEPAMSLLLNADKTGLTAAGRKARSR
ncbi:hypothetical protein LJK87_29545 [Paenibacillus sp. P25]|nr:hypothetical protein LJK87_29545 [Paenibacillus sp. P25]